MVSIDEEIDGLLIAARNKHFELTQSFPQLVDAGALGVLSKAPFKALSVREALYYRTEELTQSALILIDHGNSVAAAVLARCVMESVALQHKLLNVIKGRSTLTPGALDDVLMQLLLGFKNDQDFPKVINILTLIKSVDKTISGFSEIYDHLSEVAHPNASGVSWAYTDKGADEFSTVFGKNVNRLKVSDASAPPTVNAFCVE